MSRQNTFFLRYFNVPEKLLAENPHPLYLSFLSNIFSGEKPLLLIFPLYFSADRVYIRSPFSIKKDLTALGLLVEESALSFPISFRNMHNRFQGYSWVRVLKRN